MYLEEIGYEYSRADKSENDEQAADDFKGDLKNLDRKSKLQMVERVIGQIYGSPMRLKDVASISTPEARQLLITPFDPQNAGTISKAIEKANLGVMPMVDGNTVGINIPMMTEELEKNG